LGVTTMVKTILEALAASICLLAFYLLLIVT
jgi:hypothetical protein